MKLSATAEDTQKSPNEPLGQDALVQFRLAHLNMLQGIIGRMASCSSSVKNFAITISAASLALAIDKSIDAPLLIAFGAILLFGTLDAYYLAMERGFRETYNHVAGKPLNTACDLRIDAASSDLLKAAGSVSVWPFYLPQLAVVGGLILCREL